MDHPFEVGEMYGNRNGRYQVLSINEPKMLICYEDGREQEVGIEMQARIWRNMGFEATAVPQKSRRKVGAGKSGKKGRKLSKRDEQEKVIAEILEDDAAVFEILTRLVIPPGQINTYRLLIRNQDDFFTMQQIADETRGSDLHSLQSVLRAFGNRIRSSPDPRVQSLSPYNSLFFEHKSSGGKMMYRIRRQIVVIFESFPKFYDFLINDNRPWLPEEFGSEHWTNTPAVHKRQLEYFGLLERYQNKNE